MAGNSTISITFRLDGDNKGFRALAKDAEGFKQVITGAISEADKLNSKAINFAAISTAVSQAQNALGSLQSSLKDFANAYAVQQTAETQLETVMRQRMGATEAEIQGVKDLASAQQSLGVIGDEVQLSGAQQIATFLTEKKSLDTLIPAMNNLLAQQKGLNATSQDAVSVGNLMGKAMQGQTSALKRVGITFTDAQEQMMKYGNESQRAAMLAQIITDNVGDMNAELAKTDSGKQKQLENAIGDLKEKIGQLTNAALPFVTIAANSMIAVGGVVKLVAGVRTATAAMSAWNIKGLATSSMCRLLGVESRKSAALIRVMGGAMSSGAYKATALKIALRGLMAATGVGLAIAALTTAVELFMKALDGATSSSNSLIDAQKRGEREAQRVEQIREQETRTLEDTRAALALNIARLKEFNGTKAEEQKLVKEMNDTYGSTLGYFSSVSSWYKTLVADSEAYCRQMVLEAKTRMLANQIAQKEQENYNITHNADGTTRKYSATREKRRVPGEVYDYDAAGNELRRPDTYEELPSALDNATAAYRQNNKEIAALNNQLNNAAKEMGSIRFPVTGSATPPSSSGSASRTSTTSNAAKTPTEEERAAAVDVTEVMKRNLDCVADYDKAIADLQLKLKFAGEEQYQSIQKNIDALTEQKDTFMGVAKALGEADLAGAIDVTEVMARDCKSVSDYEKAIEQLRLKQKYANSEQYQEIQKNIDALNEEKEIFTGSAMTPPTINADATSLRDITANIDILTEKLQDASVTEAAEINKQISLWEQKADAIRNAGEVAKASFDTFREGWSAIKGIGDAVQSVTSTLKGNGDAWEKTKAVVDGVIQAYEGVMSIIGIIQLLAGASQGNASAQTVQAGASMAAATATGALAAEAPVAAAAEMPLIAANKTLAASYLEVAAASYFAAHAYLPFVGFGIASGFVASATAITKALGVTAFADGGIAYGPTLGLFGEYVGASNNPEVVAPLDKLKGMLKEDGGMAGDVTFRISGENLVGVLKRRSNHINRTI